MKNNNINRLNVKSAIDPRLIDKILVLGIMDLILDDLIHLKEITSHPIGDQTCREETYELKIKSFELHPRSQQIIKIVMFSGEEISTNY